jgi:hypothetical protein
MVSFVVLQEFQQLECSRERSPGIQKSSAVERPKARQEKSSPREWLLIGAAALAVEGISVESAGRSQGACGQRPEPAAYLRDFVLIQITSAFAR